MVSLNDTQYLVAACDSCGAIGEKELDVVKVPWRITGRLTARVALMEVLAVGAVPQMMSIAIANDPIPAGEEIMKGVREELRALNLMSLPTAISTEKNMPTKQTGLGITAIGLCDQDKLRIGRSKPGNSLFCLGLPKVGTEAANPEDPDILQGVHVVKLLSVPGVYDIIPVGSQGIRGEAEALARSIGARFIKNSRCELDIHKSAGPSTCLIYTASEDIELGDFGKIPNHKIGRLEEDGGGGLQTGNED
nr:MULTISPECIES: alpha-ribazole kinase [Desulfitobacterium]